MKWITSEDKLTMVDPTKVEALTIGKNFAYVDKHNDNKPATLWAVIATCASGCVYQIAIRNTQDEAILARLALLALIQEYEL